MNRYDVAVIGLGAWAAPRLRILPGEARRHRSRPVPRCCTPRSLVGRTRIIRKAYFEDLAYVPLLERAYELWHELELRRERDRCFRSLRRADGGRIGESDLRAYLNASANTESTSGDGRGRLATAYPQLRPLDSEIGILEPEAGIVFPEHAVATHLDVALTHGATLAGDIRVTGWRRSGDSLAVEIDGVPSFEASRIVVCAGPWIPATFATAALTDSRFSATFNTGSSRLPISFRPSGFPTFFIERAGLPGAALRISRSR